MLIDLISLSQAQNRFVPMHQMVNQQVIDTRMLDPTLQAQVYQSQMGQYTVRFAIYTQFGCTNEAIISIVLFSEKILGLGHLHTFE